MSKIVSAVNAMISNVDRISTVCESFGVLFFVYDDKYKWGLSYDDREDQYYLCYYPVSMNFDLIVSLPPDHAAWEDIKTVGYSTVELKTREAKESFAELYRLLKEKVYGMDEVLDDIIADAER